MTVGDVFPRRNLPGEAEQWGRTIETGVTDTQVQVSQLSQELQGQNRNTASSLAVLAAQLEAIQDAQTELLTRRTIVAEETYNQLINLGVDTIPFFTPQLAPVTFTLTEKRQVHVRTTVYVGTLIVHDGTGAIYNPISDVRTGMALTNHTTGVTSSLGNIPTTSGVGGNSGMMGLARSGGSLSHDDYLVLNPGSYTVFYSGEVRDLTGTQASVRIQNPRVMVEILEKAP